MAETGGRAERTEREREATKPSKTTHCEGDGLGERGPGSSDFRDALESACAWLVFPVGGLIGDHAQGRTKLEAPFRQSEARVQHERSGAGWGPGEQGLCVFAGPGM